MPLVLGLVGVLVLCILPALGITGFVLLADRTKPSASPLAGSSASPSRTPAREPVAGDRWDVFRDWMIDRVNDALAARDAALVAGNQAGFLAAGDAAKPKAIAMLRRQYASLRALKVGAMRSEVKGYPIKESGEGFEAVWKIEVAVHPCFGTSVCEESQSVHTELWRLVNRKARVQEVRVSTADQKGPRPWEVADLRAVVGARTVVAASPKYAGELSYLARQAEQAALVADRLAYGTKPSRYVVFYAGPAEWKSWYSWGPPDWAAGVSIDTGELRSEIVLNAGVLRRSFLDNLLRHEFTHASTIPGSSGNDGDWWMIEGIAEYAEMDGNPVRNYSDLPELREFVTSGEWNGKVDVVAPRDADAEAEVGAKYAVGFLAIRQLAERYGEKKMLQFFMAVVHEGKTKDAASNQLFGKPWVTVEGELGQYIRAAAG